MPSNLDHSAQAPGATGVRKDHPAEQNYLVEVVDGRNGIVRVTDGHGNDAPPRKKFAICGFAASSRNLAPFDDPAWEIWGLNQLYRHSPRATRHFDIHANWREDNVEGTDHPAYLAQMGIPIYMSSYQPSIPTCVDFPLQRVIDRVAGVDYFTSTVAYMVSYAIMLIDEQVDADIDELKALSKDSTSRGDKAREIIADPKRFLKWHNASYANREIALYGIDLIVGKEYEFQKACVEYLLGLAQARGITIRLPEACALLKQQWRYGYEQDTQGGLVQMGEVKKRGAKLQEERTALLDRLRTIDGAVQENGYWNDVMELRSRGGVVVLNE